jgi:hypothetical protein
MVEQEGKGEAATDNLGKPLDPSATKVLPYLVSNLRQALLVEANRLSSADHVTDEDLEQAYRGLSFPDRESLQFADAQAVISQALRENRVVEWVSYGMAIVLFVFGLVLLGVGVARDDVATRIGAFVGGSVVELLILIPFRFAINSRRHNIALRMLGLILNRVDDPKKVAPLLKDTFLAVVLGKAQFKGVE